MSFDFRILHIVATDAPEDWAWSAIAMALELVCTARLALDNDHSTYCGAEVRAYAVANTLEVVAALLDVASDGTEAMAKRLQVGPWRKDAE